MVDVGRALIEIKNLHVQRGKQPVLEIDRLNVAQGETLAVIGPNGAGKSTLLLALSRLLPITGGSITFGGQPLAALDALAYRRRIGLVLQDPLLLDGSVFDNVAMGLRFRRLPRAEVKQRTATGWSAGISRRASARRAASAAARASLALSPSGALLDEPSAPGCAHACPPARRFPHPAQRDKPDHDLHHPRPG
jgi:tungstate transport system ATP-binding protein